MLNVFLFCVLIKFNVFLHKMIQRIIYIKCLNRCLFQGDNRWERVVNTPLPHRVCVSEQYLFTDENNFIHKSIKALTEHVTTSSRAIVQHKSQMKSLKVRPHYADRQYLVKKPIGSRPHTLFIQFR